MGDALSVPFIVSWCTGNPGSLFVCAYGFHNMVKYREHMGRSLGLEICLKMETKIDETYHVASCCCP